MIFGIGTDICDIRRITASLARHGERLPARVLGPSELAQWRQRSQRWPERGVRYLATRFSAKEAFSKAIGLGLHQPMAWQRCEILNRASGQPYVLLHGELQLWCAARGLCVHLSMSDESDYASSFCVVETLTNSTAS